VKNARLSLLFTALVLLATTPLFGQALGYQITTDHAGFVSIPGFKPPLQVKWSVNFAGTASYPIITGGKVFAIDGGNGTVPSTLYALDASTGATLWTQPVPAGYGGWMGFAYENGGLFGATQQTPSFQSGTMFAFSASDGHQVWSITLLGQYLFSSPSTARSGMVYTSGSGGGGTVYAVKESNGQVVWTAPVENGDTSAPAVSDDAVYVSYACPQTYRFDAKTGQQIWHYSGGCEGGGGESAAVYDNLVFVRDLYNYPTDGIALTASTGSLVGGFNSLYSTAFAGGYAVLTEAETLSVAKVSNGHTRWTVTANGESFTCSPIVVNDIVYTGTSTGNLEAYSGETGQLIYSVNLGQPIQCGENFAEPLAGMSAGEGLLVVPAGNTLVALQ
jgi:outer membrane protein assembly factor BamB